MSVIAHCWLVWKGATLLDVYASEVDAYDRHEREDRRASDAVSATLRVEKRELHGDPGDSFAEDLD